MDFKSLDFTPSEQSTIVERILINVHIHIDSLLPEAEEAPKRYSKTVFNDEDKTGLVKAAIEHEKILEQNESVRFGQENDEDSDTKENNIEEDIQPNKNDRFLEPVSSDSLITQAGIEFSEMYSAIDNKKVRSNRDLVMVLLGIFILLGIGAAYFYFFEMNK